MTSNIATPREGYESHPGLRTVKVNVALNGVGKAAIAVVPRPPESSSPEGGLIRRGPVPEFAVSLGASAKPGPI